MWLQADEQVQIVGKLSKIKQKIPTRLKIVIILTLEAIWAFIKLLTVGGSTKKMENKAAIEESAKKIFENEIFPLLALHFL